MPIVLGPLQDPKDLIVNEDQLRAVALTLPVIPQLDAIGAAIVTQSGVLYYPEPVWPAQFVGGVDVGAAPPVVFEPPDFDVPRQRSPLRNFDGYTPFVPVVIAAAPFVPTPFDTPAGARRPIQATDWSFVGTPAPGVFTAFDVPRRPITARAFDVYTPFVPPAVALATFTPLPFDVPTAKRTVPGFDPYSPFVPVVAALPVFTPAQFDQPAARRPVVRFDPYAAFVPAAAATTPFVAQPFDGPPSRRRPLDFAAFSPFVPVAVSTPFTPQEFAVPPARQRFVPRPPEMPFIGQIPFVALALDRPQAQRGQRSYALLADAYVPFTPFVPPPVLVPIPFLDWPRLPVRVAVVRASFDFGDTGYYTDTLDAQTGRGPLFQWLAGQESYWRG